MNKVPVFYTPRQVAPAQGGSPSPEKPKYVVESWLQHHYPIDIRDVRPITEQGIGFAHEAKYVHDVLTLAESNGFGNKSSKVADALPYSIGSFVLATREALINRQVAVSPTSGFHHAGYDFGGGYCTFNGLMVAAVAMLNSRSGVSKLGIFDFDAHNGNGTTDIIRRMKLDERVLQYTRGDREYLYPTRRDGSDAYRIGERFLDSIVPTLHEWHREGIELLMYQAGADPHINDPLGGNLLTSEQMKRRDFMVFETCRDLEIPVVWNLAGGYQEDPALPMPQRIRRVLDIHDATMEACVEVFVARN